MSTDAPAPVAKAKRPKWHYIAGAVGALVLCGIVGNMLPDKDDAGGASSPAASTSAPASAKATDAPAPTEAPKAKVDKATFDKVETGTDCDKLADLFGGPGEVMSESEVMGIKTVALDWKANIFGANVTVMCQNGKVISKAQFGLK